MVFRRKAKLIEKERAMQARVQAQQQIQQSSAITEGVQAQYHVNEMLGNGQASFAEVMLEEKSIPKEIKELLPVFADKEFALTNIQNEEQLDRFNQYLRLATSNFRLYNSHYKQTPEIARAFIQLRAKYEAKLRRSTGGVYRERGLYTVVTNVQERPDMNRVGRRSFLSKLKGSVT